MRTPDHLDMGSAAAATAPRPAAIASPSAKPVDVAREVRRVRGQGALPASLARAMLAAQRAGGNAHVGHLLRQAQGDGAASLDGLERSIGQARGGGQAMDHGTLSRMDDAFGRDFSAVRVHTDARAHDLNVALSARAFATGQDIFFRNGEYSPGSSAGRELLAHELTHVVQQDGAELRTKLTVSEPEDDAEREADAVARAVMAHEQGPAAGPSPHLARRCAGCEEDQLARRPFAAIRRRFDQGLVQRYSWDEFTGDVSDAAGAVVSGVKEAGSAAGETLDQLADAVSPAAATTDTGGGALGGAGDGGGPAAPPKQTGIGDWLLSGAGELALKGANAIAQKFGGSVEKNPAGGIDLLLPEVGVAELREETFVLPLALPTRPLVDQQITVGSFLVKGTFGTVIGDPTGTAAVGPVRLRNIRLHLDPFGSTYGGFGQLYVGTEMVLSAEKALEGRLQAVGAVAEIPVEASAAAGLREVLRIATKGAIERDVALSYRDGNFALNSDLVARFGMVAHVDHEAFLRVELYGKPVCNLIWPFSSKTLAAGAGEIHFPFSISYGEGGTSTRFGPPSAQIIDPDTITTALARDAPTSKCQSLPEIIEMLCSDKRLPPDICAVLRRGPPAEGQADPLGGPGGLFDPIVPRFGPAGAPSAAGTKHLAPIGSQDDPIDMIWFKPLRFYPNPIFLQFDPSDPRNPDDRKQPYKRDVRQQLPGDRRRIGVPYWPEVGDKLQRLPNADTGKKGEFREALEDYGWDMFVKRQDADHVQDLAFGGADTFANLWPMAEDANRRAGTWHTHQPVTYNDPDDPADAQPKRTSLGFLRGRWFRIRKFEVP